MRRPATVRIGARIGVLALLALAPAMRPAAQEEIETFSVREQPVDQVLLAFAERSGLSVVADATVTGTVSLVLHRMSTRAVLQAIADAAGLYIDERDSVFWLSRIHIARERGGWVLACRAAPLESVVATLARHGTAPVILSVDGGMPVTVTVRGQTVTELLRLVAEQSGFALTDRAGALFLEEASVAPVPAAPRHDGGDITVTRNATGGYRLAASGVEVQQVCTGVADAAGMTMLAAEPLPEVVDDLSITAPDRDTLLSRLSVALGVEMRSDGELLLVARTGHRTPFEPLRRRAVFATGTLRATDAETILSTIPGLSIDWVDPGGYRIAVSGLSDRIVAGRELLLSLADGSPGIASFSFRCTHASASVLAAALGVRYPDIPFRVDVDTNTVYADAPVPMFDAITAFAETVDTDARRLVYRCRHAAPDIAAERVTASYSSFSATVSTDRRTVIFEGPPALHPAVRELLGQLDRTLPQIRYDICILQYQHGDTRQHGLSATVANEASGTSLFTVPFTAAAAYDRLTSLQFDFFSALGYRAALSISEELADNTARLIVDTSIRAEDGVIARLENASTYRYRDVLGDDGGEGYHAVTREIDSGLTIEISGSTRGDRTIALEIAVTVSKNGTDVSGNGNPPPTSRKLVETSSVVAVGQPIVIGGLLQREERNAQHRFPLLGSVPIVRRLVNGSTRVTEETELVLYVTAFPVNVAADTVRRTVQLRELRRLGEER